MLSPVLSEFSPAWVFSYPDMSFYNNGKLTHESIFSDCIKRDTNIFTFYVNRTLGTIRFSLNNVLAKLVIEDCRINEPYLLQFCASIRGQGKVKLLKTRNCWKHRKSVLFTAKYAPNSPLYKLSGNLLRELGYFL